MKRFIVFFLFLMVLFGLNQVHPVISEPQQHRLSMPKFQKGFSYLIYGFEDLNKKDYWFLKKTVAIYDHLEKQNANSVSIVFPFKPESYTGTSFSTTDIITPDNETLRIAIREAKRRNMVVLLRPIMDENNFDDTKGEWRGNITPQDKKLWMKNYSAMILEYAKFAEDEKVEVFGIGTELSSMLSEEQEWEKLITSVRAVYKGKITYSFNWDDTLSPRFVNKLDYIGIDSFYPIQEPTVAEWDPWIQKMAEYEAFSNKPVIFTELGTRSQKDSYQSPWGWRMTKDVDQDAQMLYYDSICQASMSVVDGWYVWHLTVNSLEINPETDPSFDVTGKKSEKVIRECYQSI